jgi:hypothetical protein
LQKNLENYKKLHFFKLQIQKNKLFFIAKVFR